MVGIKESLKVAREFSLPVSAEYSELPDELCALLSRFDRPDLLDLARRWKIFLPNTWTLSGRSREGLPLVVDRCEDRRVILMLSNSEARSDEEPEDTVRWPRWR